MPRSEDPRLLWRRGRFADDRALPHIAHGYVLQSPHTHATVNGIDVAAAKAAPHVIEVFTVTGWQALG